MYKYVILIVLTIIYSICIYTAYRQNKRVGALSGVLFSFLIYYCLIPLIVLLNYSNISNKTNFITYIYESSIESYFLFFICALLLLLPLIGSYKKALSKFSFYAVYPMRTEKYAKYFFYFSFLIGLFAFTIYVNSFGGLKNALIMAEYMRSFNASYTIPYSAALMQLPSGLLVASPLFFVLWVDKKNVWSLKNKLFFISLLLINISYLLVNAGKTGVFLFVLPLFVTLISYKTKYEWTFTILCCIIGVPMVNVLDMLFLSFTNETMLLTSDNLKTDLSLLHQFSYPISNSLNMHDILLNSELRFFKDFLTGFLTHIPGMDYEASYAPTSAFYGGTWWRESAGVPNDIMTFAYLQLGPLGIIVLGFIWGHLLGFLDCFLRVCTNSFGSKYVRYSLILFLFNVIMNADIVAIVVNFKFSLLVILIYKLMVKIKLQKNNKNFNL